jgi:hypothetical protein
MSQRLFHINAEVRPVTRAILDPGGVAGAAVCCLVAADTPDDALAALTARLKADGLELCETEWCVDFDTMERREPGDSAENELAELARRTGAVQYGTFHTWGHDAPDAR